MSRYVIRKTIDPARFKVDYKKELNKEQQTVVFNGEGPVLVLAGAGSGKTRTIVYRVAYLLERGVKPANVLLVTFTNKASKEMLMRVEELLGVFPKGLWGGTFHHIANLLLRKYGKAIGYPSNFTILDREDSKSLINICRKEEGIDVKAKMFPSPAVIQNMIGLSVNTGTPLKNIIKEKYPNFLNHSSTLESIYKHYVDRKKKHYLVDFDDMLELLDRLLKTNPEIKAKLAQQFHYVLVDEYQDTNHLQASIVEQLSSAHKNLLVVGDDAQSIYQFRGATVQNILEFPKLFNKCQIFKLETNYRSTKPVLSLANEVIKHNPDQYQKTLHPVRSGIVKPVIVPANSSDQEAEFITQRVLEFREEGIELNKMAVLFRATFQSQALEFELTRRDIPYDYRGGLRFFERAHIKDVLSFLKLIDNPRDEVSFLRIAQLYPGIGLETAIKLWRICFSNAASVEAFAKTNCAEVLTVRSKQGFNSFQKTFQSLYVIADQTPAELIKKIIKTEYIDYLQATFPNADERLDDLLQLARFSEKYRELSAFLAEVSLQESFGVLSETAPARDNESLIVSTIHQAKGLEWDVVFVIGCNEGAFPNPRALTERNGIEEERRLFYVAVTRAKTHLFLTYSIGVNMRSTNMHMQRPSQFITEQPKSLFEQMSLEEEPSDPDDILFERDELGEPKAGLLDNLLEQYSRRKKRRK
ncbi:MAG: ATP-dependent helicase [bacterium]